MNFERKFDQKKSFSDFTERSSFEFLLFFNQFCYFRRQSRNQTEFKFEQIEQVLIRLFYFIFLATSVLFQHKMIVVECDVSILKFLRIESSDHLTFIWNSLRLGWKECPNLLFAFDFNGNSTFSLPCDWSRPDALFVSRTGEKSIDNRICFFSCRLRVDCKNEFYLFQSKCPR